MDGLPKWEAARASHLVDLENTGKYQNKGTKCNLKFPVNNNKVQETLDKDENGKHKPEISEMIAVELKKQFQEAVKNHIRNNLSGKNRSDKHNDTIGEYIQKDIY